MTPRKHKPATHDGTCSGCGATRPGGLLYYRCDACTFAAEHSTAARYERCRARTDGVSRAVARAIEVRRGIGSRLSWARFGEVSQRWTSADATRDANQERPRKLRSYQLEAARAFAEATHAERERQSPTRSGGRRRRRPRPTPEPVCACGHARDEHAQDEECSADCPCPMFDEEPPEK